MKIRMGELLVKAGVISADELSQALGEQRLYGGKIGEILVRMNFLSEEVLVRALSKQLDIPRAELPTTLDPALLSRAPLELLEDLWMLPIKSDGATLTVVSSDPLNTHAKQRLEAASRMTVNLQVGTATAIGRGLDELRRQAAKLAQAAAPKAEENVFVDNAGRRLSSEPSQGPRPADAPGVMGGKGQAAHPNAGNPQGRAVPVPGFLPQQGRQHIPQNSASSAGTLPPRHHPGVGPPPNQAYPASTAYPPGAVYPSAFPGYPAGAAQGQREGGGLIGQTLPPSYFPYGPSYPYPYPQQTYPPSYPFYPQGAVPPGPVPGTLGEAGKAGERFHSLEESQRRESLALRELVELLIDKGVITLDEYLARLKR